MQVKTAGFAVLKRIGWTYLSVEAAALLAYAIVFILAAVLGVIAAAVR